MAYPVSAAFAAALSSSQLNIVAEATVTAGGRPILGPIPVETATLTVSRNQAQRSTLTATLDPATPGVVPTSMASPLAPNGNELVFSYGVAYPNGTRELVPCGVFPIQTATVTDTGTDLTVQVAAADRSWSISRRGLLQPYTVGTDTTLAEALAALVTANNSGMPPFAYSIYPTSAIAAPNSYRQGQDPWQAAMDLADGAGYECYFDRYGNLQAYPTPDPATLPLAWSAEEGATAGPSRIVRTFTAVGVYNDFFVSSSSATVSPPVQAEASDTNPTSPTWVDGTFGDIPSFLMSPAVADATGAAASAESELLASIGQVDSTTITILANPAIDIDDIFTVTRDRMGLAAGTRWIVDAYTMPVGTAAGEMTVNLRRVFW